MTDPVSETNHIEINEETVTHVEEIKTKHEGDQTKKSRPKIQQNIRKGDDLQKTYHLKKEWKEGDDHEFMK